MNISNEVIAISTALFLTMEDSIHDYESNVLTIQKVNSAWNLPIYNVLEKINL